jgi:hypothetical protein
VGVAVRQNDCYSPDFVEVVESGFFGDFELVDSGFDPGSFEAGVLLL